MLSRRNLIEGAGTLALMSGTSAPARAQSERRALSNPHASARARRLYAYLWSAYGRHTLTGQQESTWSPEGPRAELDYVQRVTGKLPAILGLDYIEPADRVNVNDRATRWYLEEGGIPTLCWHWGAPDIGTGYENSKKPFDLPAALTPGTRQHELLERDLATIADHLQVLRDRGVPVLWRPLHEFSGDWFWWGQHGPEPFKALWARMYDLFTHERRLDNLIWVAGYAGQSIDPSWYPGRDRVDVAGADTYVHDHGALAPMFGQVKAIVGDTVPICLHENGPIPDPALLGPSSDWLYFMTWHTKWIRDAEINPSDFLRSAYASERYLTKDELPKLRG